MTRIGTPSSGITPTSLTQGPAVSALLTQLPSTLSHVAVGTFLTGTVVDRNPNGLTLLQTPNGLLGLKTTVPLPPGSTVTLQIQTAGAQLQAIVLSVATQASGGSPAPSHPPLPAHPAAASPTAAPAPAAPSAAAPTPSTITATVIGPSGGPVPASVAQPVQTAPAASSSQAAPTAQSATTPSPSSSPAQTASPAPSTPPATSGAPTTAAASMPAASAAPATPQTVLANSLQPAPAGPAAAQAAYQRQLNAVPSAPAPTAPTVTPAAPAVIASTPPAVPSTATATSAAGAQSASAASEANVARPIPIEAATAPLPTGTQVQVRLLSTLQTTQPAQPLQLSAAPADVSTAIARPVPAATATPNPVIAATVVARTPAGQVVLDSAVGRLLAPLPRDVETSAPGARLLLELIMGERPTASRPAPSGLAALARNWSTLKDAMRQLQDAPGQHDAAAALDRALPKAGPRLAQQMLSYLENAQNGVKAWLGEPVARVLGQFGGQRMVEQLDRDLREMQLARHGTEGEWRMTLVPLLDNGQLRQIRFFERRRKQEEEKRKKEEPARFVVECETSEHGAIQLDGLMHEKRIDLIVRSHAPLPTDMEHDIVVLFGETCNGLELTGQVFFQAVPAFPVSPLDDIAKAPVRVEV